MEPSKNVLRAFVVSTISFLCIAGSLFAQDFHDEVGSGRFNQARRISSGASWEAEEQGSVRPEPSLQSHVAPMLFATFNASDIRQEKVMREIQRQLQRSYRNGHAETLLRSEAYRDFIAARLQSRRLPPELISVAAIESAFDIRAESRTGARGLWQFADNSMAPWLDASDASPRYDQRFDFWKSSEAAMEKLSQNYQATGSWLFALAAYSGGLGRMTRSMDGGSFWDMEIGPESLSEQMAEYIPRFIAVSIVMNYPGRFALPRDWAPPLRWQRILLDDGLDLAQFSRDSNIPLSVLEGGNAEYLDGHIPSGAHFFKYPQVYSSQVQNLLGLSSSDGFHRVSQGDTLWSISRRYAISLDTLLELNNLHPQDTLHVGVYLRIDPDIADN